MHLIENKWIFGYFVICQTLLQASELTSTTTAGWSCDPPDGAEGPVFCPDNNFLLRAMGSRTPFFSDATAAACTNMNEQVFNDEEEVLVFFSLDGGLTLNAECPHEHHVVYKFTLCVKKEHAAAITLHCRMLKDPDRIEDHFNVTSDDYHNFVNCEDNGAIQKIWFMDARGDGITTRMVFYCVKIHVEGVTVPLDPPGDPPGDAAPEDPAPGGLG